MELLKIFVFITTVSVFAASSFQKGANHAQISTTGLRIVGGVNGSKHEFPSLVSIQLVNNDEHSCGGTIVNSNWVITTASCAKDVYPGDLRVVAGKTILDSTDSDEQISVVKKAVLHPDYYVSSNGWSHNGVALLELETPLNFITLSVKPANLPDKDFSPDYNEKGTVAGWGSSIPGGDFSNVLRKLTVPLITPQICKEEFVSLTLSDYIAPSIICANSVQDKGFCDGDSGSGLYCGNPEKALVLCGVALTNIDCGVTKSPDVYLRVSAFTEWIDCTIRNEVKL